MIDLSPMTRPRIAASSYLNTAPLVWNFRHGSQRDRVELIAEAAPSRCAELLSMGAVEAALVPAIEYQRIPDLVAVPDVCVGSRSAVRSVVLTTRLNNLHKIKSIALDTSSRTSATLIQVIFREFLGSTPRVAPAAPDVAQMLRTADAALIIGDPAMTFARQGLHVFDLATLWREFTGHGFVFALWMGRREQAQVLRSIDFAAARDAGLAHLSAVLEEYAHLGWSVSDRATYLRENVTYELDSDLRAGLELFYDLAAKHDLTPPRRPLIWVE